MALYRLTFMLFVKPETYLTYYLNKQKQPHKTKLYRLNSMEHLTYQNA